jgi:hypothetical protein
MTQTSFSSPAMPNLITVSELVDRAAPPSEDHRAIWLRRARLWSIAKILPAATPQGGTRKHRAYSENVVFLAAVLFRISDFGITTEIPRELSNILQISDQGRSAFSRIWRHAKRGVSIKYALRHGFVHVISGAYILVTLPRPGNPHVGRLSYRGGPRVA